MSSQKLPVRFPLITRSYVSDVAANVGATSSEVARAALLFGLAEIMEMKNNEKEEGITLLKVQNVGKDFK